MEHLPAQNTRNDLARKVSGAQKYGRYTKWPTGGKFVRIRRKDWKNSMDPTGESGFPL